MSAIAVISGTTHGIGRVASLELARAGRTVIMLCRNLELAQQVRREISQAVPGSQVHIVHCDLASLGSVRQCAEELCDRFGPIHLLINNAGIVSARHRMSIDGFELTFATNYLGPFLLTRLLLNSMASDGGRIVNVASRVHYRGRLDFESVRDARASYLGTAAYAQSKLANVLHTFALARRLAGSGVTVNCLHPGVVATNLLPRWLRVIKPLLSRVIFDAERGARTTLYLALASEAGAITGQYFDENQKVCMAAALATDVALQERLWKQSCAWVGVDA